MSLLMIRSLHLANFKCFGQLRLDLAPLTLLTGTNGSGKSSAIQAILLATQSLTKGGGQACLNGPLVSLGAASDVLFYGATEEETHVLIEHESGTVALRLTYEPGVRATSDARVDASEGASLPVDYVSADRLGPRPWLPLSDDGQHLTNVGTKGEFVAHYLSVWGDKPLENDRFPRHHTVPGVNALAVQVAAWMSEISPGVRINVNSVNESDIASIRYAFEAEKDVTPHFRASNVGFGISYSLPVVVALLAAKPGETLIIENPEAHLHPRGQTSLGQLAALVAVSGVQLIVETHSDHFLDAVRLAAKENLISPEQCAIYYFIRDGTYHPQVTRPILDSNGRLSEWPEGFFDQSEIVLSRLAGASLD